MKKFIVYFMACLLLCNSVLADFEDVISNSTEVTPDETQVPLEKVDEVVSSLPDMFASSVSEVADSGNASEVSPGGNTVYVLTDHIMDGDADVGASPADPVLTNVAVATGLSPVTPNDATGLKAVLLSFIGNYDPPIIQFEYTTNNNYKQYVNEIQPDYVWICSFALIALFIFCLFKLGGVLLRG